MQSIAKILRELASVCVWKHTHTHYGQKLWSKPVIPRCLFVIGQNNSGIQRDAETLAYLLRFSTCFLVGFLVLCSVYILDVSPRHL